MTGDAQTVTARWVFPACGPPLERGTVTTAGGRILAVEPHGTRAADLDLGNAALIPGLVNAHTHLDLSGARGLIPPTTPDHFTDWLRGVIAYRRARTPEQTRADTRAGLAECLRHGTTLIGDVAADGQSWDALAAAPMRAVVFREMIGLSEERAKQAWDAAETWRHEHTATSTTRPGLSPHAPYSASAALINTATCLRDATAAIHLAESPGEIELISRGEGPFVEFLQSLGVWEPSQIQRNMSRLIVPFRLVDHALFIHCNYLPHEYCRNIAGIHTVVYCPRTHAAFGHPPHPFRAFLAGRPRLSFREFPIPPVRVCLGTDGLASNPDLDILAEARFVHARYPDFPGDTLLKMVTRFGAEALGWADETGSLEPGKSADLVAVPLPDRDAADPHDLLFAADAPAAPRRTLFRGEWR